MKVIVYFFVVFLFHVTTKRLPTFPVMQIHLSTIFIFALVCSATISGGFACKCKFQLFKEAYESADSVVKARVTSIAPYNPFCTKGNCILATKPRFLTITFKLLRTFKGCGPRTVKFYGKTTSSSAACGFFFKKGGVYLLNSPRITQVRRLGHPTSFYNLNICQFHSVFTSLSKPDRLFLRKQLKSKPAVCLWGFQKCSFHEMHFGLKELLRMESISDRENIWPRMQDK